MALLHLAQNWGGADLLVATVNHGLRPEAGTEAALVAQEAARLGLPHVTLHWQGWDGRGNLQDQARQARQELLRDWAAREALGAIALGHTRDDQAETLLLRLARGSGVDGLAGMAARREDGPLLWLRPLLSFSRDELRDWLHARGVPWVEDPSNDDPRFDRVKIRQALAALDLDPARLAETATRMAEARAVLDQTAQGAARALGRSEAGDVVFDRRGFDALAIETRQRLLAEALRQIASSPYRPRLSALQMALAAPRATLHGCLITRSAKDVRITREAQAVRGVTARLGADWDRRWSFIPPKGPICKDRLEIRALGAEGLAQCPDRIFWHLPRASLLASPAIWDGAELIAAPLTGLAPEWQAKPRSFTGVLAELTNSH